ncbi:MAG: dockerin type I repeat-containing protein [Candidatus Zixiibacteriota bacterium]
MRRCHISPVPALIMTILLTLIVGTLGFGQDVTLTDVTFSQLDWYSPEYTLAVENSMWGQLNFSYVSDTTTTYYLNLAIEAQDFTVQWMVGNLPLFPSLTEMSKDESVNFDLTQLGYAEGDDVIAVTYALVVTSYPLESMPTEPMIDGAVFSEIRYAWMFPQSGDTPLAVRFPTNVDLPDSARQVGADRVINRVEEAAAHCYAGAMARSIDWLNRTHHLGMDAGAQEIYDSLVGRGLSNSTDGSSPSDWLNRKEGFAISHSGGKITTKTWTHDSTMNFIDWLKREIKTEDVEIWFDHTDTTFGHIVTVVDVFQDSNGDIYVKYKDDGRQGDDTSGNRTKTVKITFGGDGKYRFGSDGCPIVQCVSESVRSQSSAGITHGRRKLRRVFNQHQNQYHNPRAATDLHFSIGVFDSIDGWSITMPGFGTVEGTQNGPFQFRVDANYGAVPYCTYLKIPISVFVKPGRDWDYIILNDIQWTYESGSKSTDSAVGGPGYSYSIAEPVNAGPDGYAITITLSNINDTATIVFSDVGAFASDVYYDDITIIDYPAIIDTVTLAPGESVGFDIYSPDNSIKHIYGYFGINYAGSDEENAEWFDAPMIVYLCGDANGDTSMNIGDAVYLINYIFKGGPAPDPECVGDANGDGSTNIGDAVYLIQYIFSGGPSPVDDCCD